MTTTNPTPSGWTKADENGFYWWRFDKDDTPEPVDARDGFFYSIADRSPTSTTVGEFLGPITVTDTERLARLEAERDKFSTLADERHDLLCAERRANDELRAERAKMLAALERAQQERNRLKKALEVE